MARFASQRAREVRRQAAMQSGIRLVVRGGALGVLSVAAAYFASPALFSWTVVPLGVLSALVFGFGALKMLSAFLARPR